MINQIVEQIKRHEGFSAFPYQCTSGKWTIGYGFTYLYQNEAETILKMRIKLIQDTLSPRIENLSENRQAVLINMAFNLGVMGLYKFKKMWTALENGDYEQAAIEMLDSVWAEQVGQRAVELSHAMRIG